MISAIFVYGTLLPGLERWPILARFVTDEWHHAQVDGQLFDTGHGYPAAVFGDSERDLAGATIEGLWFGLRPALLDEALAALDEAEAVDHGLYQRIVLDTAHGPAWSYEYQSGCDRLTALAGRWPAWSGTGPDTA
ncbi:MAG: hypothetical protein HKN26_03690 [Acidimicrobiales bacterium]|nr:hypothetical protein [Acidimicrobiales bacterium]